jgi:hypothetical protein
MVSAAFAGGFVAQVLVGGPPAHAQEAAHRQLRVRRLVVVDERGTERAVLAAEPEGAGLVIKDGSGNPRMRLGMLPADQVGIVLTAADQKTQLALGAFESTNHFDIYDGEERPRFTVGIDREHGNGGLAFYDAQKNERLAIGMGPGGGGDFVAKDQYGNDLWRALGDVGPPLLP